MIHRHRKYEINDDLARIDFERVQDWLSTTYWSPGISRDTVERAARHSALVVGTYVGPTQVGYLRVVSDRTTFAWVCDVFVDASYRGQGLARAMMGFALAHPDYQHLRRWRPPMRIVFMEASASSRCPTRNAGWFICPLARPPFEKDNTR